MMKNDGRNGRKEAQRGKILGRMTAGRRRGGAEGGAASGEGGMENADCAGGGGAR